MRKAKWPLIVIVVAGLLSAAGWWTYAEVWPRTLVHVRDVQAEVAARLPRGTSEADTVAYLQSRGYGPSEVSATSLGDAYLRSQGVPVGTRALRAEVVPSRRHLFAEPSRINIWVTFDSAGQLDRTYVYEQ